MPINNLAVAGGKTFAKVIKSADQTVNNSTTKIDDDELLFTPAINKTYHGILLLCLDSSAVADMDLVFTVPTGATIFGSVIGDWDPGTPVDWSNMASEWNLFTSGNDQVIEQHFRLIMSSTAGAVTLQWAQGTAEVSDTKVLEGSLLLVWEE